MSGIEAFLGAAKPGSSEGKLVEAYNQAKIDLERKQSDLVKCLRIEKVGDRLIPAFSPEAANLAGPHWDSEALLLEIQADIQKFLTCTNGEPLSGLLDRLSRARRIVNDSVLDARNAVERSIRNHAALNVREAEALPEVQSAFDKRDRTQSEKGPIISDLESRVREAKKILAKY